MTKIDFDLNISNLGPHEKLNMQKKISSLKIGIFGSNAVGKTFISKVFDLIDKDNKYENANDLLRINENKCNFFLRIKNEEESFERNLTVKIERNKPPIIKNDTKYIFHVFNSKFVRENIEINNYNLDEKIEGVIFGERNIKLTKEKNRLENLKSKQLSYASIIETDINEVKAELKSLGVGFNLKEFEDIKLQNIVSDKEVLNHDYDSIKNTYLNLKEMPDNLPDLIVNDFVFDFSFLDDINDLLKIKYEKFSYKEDFRKIINENHEFIKLGINLYDNFEKDKCPFCHQNLNDVALEIISNYEDFVNDKESKIIERIDEYIEMLINLENKINKNLENFYNLNEKYIERRKMFLNFINEDLKFTNNSLENINESINRIKFLLNLKQKNISECYDIDDEISFLYNFKQDLNLNYNKNLDIINRINIAKKNNNVEKRDLRRKLCDSKYNYIKNLHKNNIEEYNNLENQIIELTTSIIEQDKKNQLPKKEAVIKSLQKILKFFFNEKYVFDENSFSIKFKDKLLYEDIEDFLSDGEKNILAFCYYLSLVHTKVQGNKDYKKLFFIIDDPISSMDYNHVYNVANCIKYIENHIPKIGDNKRYIILTHNLNFMNVLIGNKITTQNFYLESNHMDKINKQLTTPYISHLKDIKNVSNGRKLPSHTTCNSIRQVLEYISKFEGNYENIKDFIDDNKILKENGDRLILINDASHLTPGKEVIDNVTVKLACENIINFIKEKYPAQLKGI